MLVSKTVIFETLRDGAKTLPLGDDSPTVNDEQAEIKPVAPIKGICIKAYWVTFVC